MPNLWGPAIRIHTIVVHFRCPNCREVYRDVVYHNDGGFNTGSEMMYIEDPRTGEGMNIPHREFIYRALAFLEPSECPFCDFVDDG